MTEPPAIEPGERLLLRAHQWRNCTGTTTPVPGDDRTIVVVRVYTAVMDGMVWMYGHLPGCGCTTPWCVEGQVSVTALREHAERRQR